MSARRSDALTAAILAASDAAQAGARAMRVPERDVEDVVQETMLATWRRAQRGDFPADREALRTYLFVVARNVAMDMWRQLGRVELPGALPEPAVDPLPRLEARAELRALPRPAYLRAIFECLAAGESLRDVGLPRGTVATRLRRLRGHLRRH
jgi:DNA-directed RNA polymerase specialized sigma24 family protein